MSVTGKEIFERGLIQKEDYPEPPSDKCPHCGLVFIYTPKDEVYGPSDFRSQGVYRFHWVFYDREEHPGCQEAELRAQECIEKENQKERYRNDVSDYRSRNEFPKDFEKKTFENYEIESDNQKAFDTIQALRPDDEFGLLLIGAAGTGKSHLALALINQEINRFDPTIEPRRRVVFPIYRNASMLLNGIKQSDFRIPDQYFNCRTLVVDDLGAENCTDWTRDIFFQILDARLNKKLQTIITTNLSLNELKERMHERVVSRMLGLCVPVVIKGQDFRRKGLADAAWTLAERAKSANSVAKPIHAV